MPALVAWVGTHVMTDIVEQKSGQQLVARIPQCRSSGVPVGNSILLATDIESGDAPALCERSVA